MPVGLNIPKCRIHGWGLLWHGLLMNGPKRVWEQYKYKGKEEGCRELLRCLKGFYVGASNAGDSKAEFLSQLNRCWLYCSDDVILKGYAFLDTVHVSNPSTDEVKEKAMGNFVASIRNDLLTRKLVRSTKLNGSDFKHFG